MSINFSNQPQKKSNFQIFYNLTQNPKTNNQTNCLKNATNKNEEQGKGKRSQKQNKQNDMIKT